MLWGSSYLVRQLGIHEEQAASMASLFYPGMTGGRFVSGFLTMKINDSNMIRLGQSLIAIGVVVMILPLGQMAAFVGLLLIGLGCAPIYPCIIHSTPAHFGEENSQAMVGVQMASAYSGSLLMPLIFGLIANHISAALLPLVMGIIGLMMIFMCERLNRIDKE
jgi:fucose permease